MNIKKFWKGLKHLLSDDWIAKWAITDGSSTRYVNINGERKDVSNYTEAVVKGTGMTRWGIKDGARLFIRPFKDDKEKHDISMRPVVMIVESGAYWFECDRALKKFSGYIDIWPEGSDTVSSEIWEHAQDTSTFMLHPDFNYDINEYSRYYTLNHPSLPGINRMQFIKLCQDTLSSVIRTIHNNQNRSGERPFDYHHMAIVCVCYNAAYDYMIVPTESIHGIAEYVITD